MISHPLGQIRSNPKHFQTGSYTFTQQNGRQCTFRVDPDRAHETRFTTARPQPWTKLEFHQCTNCPLRPAERAHCPVAVDVEEIALQFADVVSHESASVQVETADRTYSKRCDVQTGLRSLLGLVMATSACPILAQLEGLAPLPSALREP